MAGFVPQKCRPGCRYAMAMTSRAEGTELRGCGYLLQTGKMRGCDPGPECSRYQRGQRRQRGSGAGLRNYGQKQGPKFKWDAEAGRRMWLEGKTDREIADALGTRRDNVGFVRRKYWMKEAGDG